MQRQKRTWTRGKKVWLLAFVLFAAGLWGYFQQKRASSKFIPRSTDRDVRLVSFAPDGKVIAVQFGPLGTIPKIELRDVQTGKLLRVLAPPPTARSISGHFAWSHDSQFLATGYIDQTPSTAKYMSDWLQKPVPGSVGGIARWRISTGALQTFPYTPISEISGGGGIQFSRDDRYWIGQSHPPSLFDAVSGKRLWKSSIPLNQTGVTEDKTQRMLAFPIRSSVPPDDIYLDAAIGVAIVDFQIGRLLRKLSTPSRQGLSASGRMMQWSRFDNQFGLLVGNRQGLANDKLQIRTPDASQLLWTLPGDHTLNFDFSETAPLLVRCVASVRPSSSTSLNANYIQPKIEVWDYKKRVMLWSKAASRNWAVPVFAFSSQRIVFSEFFLQHYAMQIRHFDSTTGKELQRIKPKAAATSNVLSSDGKFWACWYDNLISVGETTNNKPFWSFRL